MSSGFSSALKLTDLDDFITPSQECIKPITSKVPKPLKKGQIQVEGASEASAGGEKVKITLNDCLACSGCITSAEVILVNEQSIEQLLKVLEKNSESTEEDQLTIVVSLSCQSILSLRLKYGLGTEETLSKVVGYFKKLGVHHVFDINVAKCLSILEAQYEFVERYEKKSSEEKSLPMLASACPGFVCYAEKTHGPLLIPHISTTRSPQQVMGSLIKKHWAQQMGLTADKIYHASLMPCFDKKLEASRDEFFVEGSETREIDCVITTVEVEDLLMKNGVDLKSISGSSLDSSLSLSSSLSSFEGSGSGGFAHHVFIHAANKLFGIHAENLKWKVMRNNDLQELTLDVDGETKLRFALAYGFKNIQNLVQKIKRKKCTYDYVEVMACPSGCLNGGAQSRPVSGQSNKELIALMESSFNNLPKLHTTDPKASTIFSQWLGTTGQPGVQENLHTTYKLIEKTINPLGIKW